MICLYLLATQFILHLVKTDNIIRTNSGPVRGTDTASGRIQAFLGIPFAEPPVGKLRFAKPVQKTWTGVYDATRHGPPCIQTGLGISIFEPDLESMSEDCLYLNLWVPRSRPTDALKTVMVFIHGGGFITGANSMQIYDGAELSEYGDVIVATVNYRLGALGFFTGFTEDAPGNLAFYDQIMAIRWIKENAPYFHGNPNNIVLFGESAGAFSVSMHQISPLSKNLFSRVILQSGSAINPSAVNDNKKLFETSLAYSELLGCANDRVTFEANAKGVIDCLRKLPADKFADADKEIALRRAQRPLPRVGDDFLPEGSIASYLKGNFKDTEVLLGITKDEGTLLLVAGRPDIFGRLGEKDITKVFNETSAYFAIKAMLPDEDPSEHDDIIRSYLNRVYVDTGYTLGHAVGEVLGDSVIVCGKIFQSELQSRRKNPVYFYMFDHRPSSSPYAEWMGVAHFDEVQFVFGNPMTGPFTEYERELSRSIMDMWVTFAKTGSPNKPGAIVWPRYSAYDPKYLIIGERGGIGIRPDNYRCEKWRNLFRMQPPTTKSTKTKTIPHHHHRCVTNFNRKI